MGSNCFFVCQLWDAVNFFPKALGLWKPGEKKLDDFLLFFISLWGIFKFKTISLKTKITIENSSISAVALIGISSDHYWRVFVYCSNRMGKFQLLGFLQGKIFLGKKKKRTGKKKYIYTQVTRDLNALLRKWVLLTRSPFGLWNSLVSWVGKLKVVRLQIHCSEKKRGWMGGKWIQHSWAKGKFRREERRNEVAHCKREEKTSKKPQCNLAGEVLRGKDIYAKVLSCLQRLERIIATFFLFHYLQ